MIAGASGVIDINHLAVDMWMDRLGVADKLLCHEAVAAMFDGYMSALREKEKTNAEPED